MTCVLISKGVVESPVVELPGANAAGSSGKDPYDSTRSDIGQGLLKHALDREALGDIHHSRPRDHRVAIKFRQRHVIDDDTDIPSC
mmetsp:Transcript_16761/g.23474  ORF Transcript_16761/g.23474 Transcript_16761/m.23474 type:complete len:86 (-) Transcript_16761:2-259(-)